MADNLLAALEIQGKANMLYRRHEFTFQHKPCHDFVSLIWVIVYATMARRKNVLAASDPKAHEDFKGDLDILSSPIPPVPLCLMFSSLSRNIPCCLLPHRPLHSLM